MIKTALSQATTDITWVLLDAPWITGLNVTRLFWESESEHVLVENEAKLKYLSYSSTKQMHFAGVLNKRWQPVEEPGVGLMQQSTKSSCRMVKEMVGQMYGLDK